MYLYIRFQYTTFVLYVNTIGLWNRIALEIV